MLDRSHPDDRALRALTGVRSGKNSYYRELRRTEERMTSAVRALEVISSALVRTRDEPHVLLRAVLHAAADHLAADWTMIALRNGALPGLDDRFLAIDPHSRVIGSELSLPTVLLEELNRMQHEVSPTPVVHEGWVRVPMTLDGQVLGQLVASHPAGESVDDEDLWVLRILVNQAALAMHTALMYGTASDLRERAQGLYDEIAERSADLQNRTEELERAEERLRELHQRELLDAERHRIALELHDSVAQYVLSAGLVVDVCRAEANERSDPAMVERLVGARDLIAMASDQVRSVIYALHNEPADGETASLKQLLDGLAAQHRHDMTVTVRIEGRHRTLDADVVHALARVAGEALFNVATHAKATQASVRVRYTPRELTLSIGDDGHGDPRDLRRLLRIEQRGDSDGRHQGLAGMASRAKGIGASISIRRAQQGGVRISVQLPFDTTTQKTDELGDPS